MSQYSSSLIDHGGCISRGAHAKHFLFFDPGVRKFLSRTAGSASIFALS